MIEKNIKQLIYKHTNLINGKVYIGITHFVNNPNLRWRNGQGYEENKKFFDEIIKYGWENFSHEILETDLNLIEASKKETEYIRLFNSVEKGYNNVEVSGILTDKARKILSKKLTGITRSKESIAKQLETKKKRYGSQRGENYQGSVNKKVRCKETGDIFLSISEACRYCGSCKVGECCRGHRQHAGHHPITFQLLSWEQANPEDEVTIYCETPNEFPEKVKKRQPGTLKIKCVETNKIYNGATEAFLDTGINKGNILRACRGIRKTAGKMHWIIIEEGEE